MAKRPTCLVRIPKPQYEKLKAVADREGRTLVAQMARLIDAMEWGDFVTESPR